MPFAISAEPSLTCAVSEFRLWMSLRSWLAPSRCSDIEVRTSSTSLPVSPIVSSTLPKALPRRSVESTMPSIGAANFADVLPDRLGLGGRVLGQLADLVGDDGEALARLARVRGLDRRVHGQQVRLARRWTR